MNPIVLAKELAKALGESSEYQDYKKARDKMEEHEAAKIMWEDLRRKQLELEKKRLTGEKLTEKDMEELKKLSEIINLNPYVKEFLITEMKFTEMMMEVQKIIAEGVGLKIPEIGDLEEGENT